MSRGDGVALLARNEIKSIARSAKESVGIESVFVFTAEDASSIPILQESQEAQVSVAAITKEVALGKPKGLKVDKSLDWLHSRVLKEIAVEIAEALVVIFQSQGGLNQHSFIKGKLQLTNALEFFDSIMSNLRQSADVIYVYFQKAFDKMLHRRLL
eukprot:g46560.t1